MNHEGVVLQSYKDSVGVWTIGVGHTAAAGVPRPRPGLKITIERAVELFREDIWKYETGVNEAVYVPLAQAEFDALVSFHFNTGAIARASITKHLNAGNRKKAGASFMNWTRAGNNKTALSKRRKSERAMFESADYGDISEVLVYPTVTKTGRPTGAKSVPTGDLLNDMIVTKPLADSVTFLPMSGLIPAILAILAAIAAFVTKKIGAW